MPPQRTDEEMKNEIRQRYRAFLSSGKESEIITSVTDRWNAMYNQVRNEDEFKTQIFKNDGEYNYNSGKRNFTIIKTTKPKNIEQTNKYQLPQKQIEKESERNKITENGFTDLENVFLDQQQNFRNSWNYEINKEREEQEKKDKEKKEHFDYLMGLFAIDKTLPLEQQLDQAIELEKNIGESDDMNWLLFYLSNKTGYTMPSPDLPRPNIIENWVNHDEKDISKTEMIKQPDAEPIIVTELIENSEIQNKNENDYQKWQTQDMLKRQQQKNEFQQQFKKYQSRGRNALNSKLNLNNIKMMLDSYLSENIQGAITIPELNASERSSLRKLLYNDYPQFSYGKKNENGDVSDVVISRKSQDGGNLNYKSKFKKYNYKLNNN